MQTVQVFSKEWFDKYQQRILWLLNSPYTKRWFRWCMRIRKCDCPVDMPINRLTPNSFTYGAKVIGDRLELTTDFRTHDKFSKRMYYAFRPFWYVLHFFDWAMLDRVEALTQLSFGFSTLTQYPGSIGAGNPTDGYAQRSLANQTWSNIQSGAGTSADATPSRDVGMEITAGTSSNTWTRIARSIYCYDTSALTSGATISAAVMSISGRSKADPTPITPNIDVYTSTPASTSTLAAGDYSQVGSTSQSGSPIAYSSIQVSTTVAAYNDFTFNATGISNISKTGISQFGMRNANYDVANSTPTWANGSSAFLEVWYSEQTGTSMDPKIVITYTIAAGPTNLKTYNTNVKANIKTIDTNAIANVKTLDTNS